MPNGVDPPQKMKSFGVGNQRSGARVLTNSIKKGYAVNLPSIYPKQTNALLIDQVGRYIYLYATDFETGAEMSGSTAQSQRVKQFFPNEFVQPVLSVTCIAPNSYQYNRFANFVRGSHHLAVNGGQKEKLVTFKLFNNTKDNPKSPYRGGRSPGRQITKGPHSNWYVRGWVESAKAGAKKEDHAPVFQFNFVIVQSMSGPLGQDKLLKGADLEDWMTYFYGLTKGEKEKTFVQQEKTPAKKPAKQSVRRAKKTAFGIPSLDDSPFDSYGDDALPGSNPDLNIGPWAEGYDPEPEG